MKDKNDWIAQGIQISCKQKISMYAFAMYGNDPKAKVYCTEYCKILREIIQELKLQHYSKLIAKPNSKIKTAWTIINKEARKVHSVEQVPNLLVNDEKLKDPTNMANALNNFFITITEELNIQHRE